MRLRRRYRLWLSTPLIALVYCCLVFVEWFCEGDHYEATLQ